MTFVQSIYKSNEKKFSTSVRGGRVTASPDTLDVGMYSLLTSITHYNLQGFSFDSPINILYDELNVFFLVFLWVGLYIILHEVYNSTYLHVYNNIMYLIVCDNDVAVFFVKHLRRWIYYFIACLRLLRNQRL